LAIFDFDGIYRGAAFINQKSQIQNPKSKIANQKSTDAH